MTRHVALLRGINVGRANQLPMGPLRDALAARGYGDVRTHLRSGNVVLTAAERSPHAVAEDVSALIREGFGLTIPVVVRSHAQLRRVVERNPFADVADDGARLMVTFLEPAPDATARRAVEALDPDGFLPERFRLDGDALYAWYANGSQGSALGRALERLRLPGTATTRNWNTVLKLVELAADRDRLRDTL